jgi:molecular chaperone HtpG
MKRSSGVQGKANSETRKMELDFHGLIKILAENLYNSKDTFIRELIQNSHDACWRRHHRDKDFRIDQARIDILSDLASDPAKIIFRDNGEGMSRQEVIDFLSAIGRSGTRESKADIPETIGQFGIGFLSGFVIGARLELRTRRFDLPSDDGVYWASDGDRSYDLAHATVEPVGTEVVVYLKGAAERGYATEEALGNAVRRYADLLKVAIHINDPDHARPPVNTRTMPWEREFSSEAESDFENRIYLEKNVRDSVLEVIPLRESDIQGLLYITKWRVLTGDVPRTMRVFLKRMYLCDNATDLLPGWATFVNGIIDTSALESNAARDNFMKGDAANTIRERLGRIVIDHLDSLKESNPDRLSEILLYHDLAIKGACHYHDEFYDKFFHLLEWRVNPGSPLLEGRLMNRHIGISRQDNSGRLRLPEIQKGLEAGTEDGPVRLSFFASSASRSQFFQIADAAGSTVIDASHIFEEELLRTWARTRRDKVTLLPMGQHDDPNLFRPTVDKKDEAVIALARAMTTNIRIADGTRLSVDVRRLKPESVAAILRDQESTEGLRKAESILHDPNASAEMKRLAEDMMGMSSRLDIKLVINAESSLVCGIAAFVQAERKRHAGEMTADAQELMLALYNSALLANQRMMSATNASLFHRQFQRLMEGILSKVEEIGSLRALNERLESEGQAAGRLQREPLEDRKHVSGLYITPFDGELQPVREEMRRFFEHEFHCQLNFATDIKHDRWIHANVRQHIQNADFFVVDMTGLNDNVLMEMGAIDFGRPDAPVLVVTQPDKGTGDPNLPINYQGVEVHPYRLEDGPQSWRAEWHRALRADPKFKTLLERAAKAQFVSPGLLKEMAGGIVISDAAIEALARRFPTLAELGSATEAGIEQCLKGEEERDFAQALYRRLTREAIKRRGGA